MTIVRRLRDAWTLAAVLFLLAASFTAFFQWNQARVDVKAYWDAGTHFRLGEPLYASAPVAALDKAYLYPPAFAAAFAPLTALPPLWGYAVWMALQLLLVAALAHACAALAGLSDADTADAGTEARRTGIAMALAAGIVPLYSNVGEGQVNVLTAWLCALAVLAAERGHDRRAAFALAAAVHVKLVPIVLAAAFLLWRRTRLLGWLAVALVAIGLLPLAGRLVLLGGAGWSAFLTDYRDFWHAILWPAASVQHVAGVEQLFAPNHSLRGAFARLLVDGQALSPFPALADRRGPLLVALPRPWADGIGTVSGLVAIGSALWLCWRSGARRDTRVAAAGLLLVAGALAGPSFWPHHLVVLAIAGAGLRPLVAERDPRMQRIAWSTMLTPLFATLTVPFFAALLTTGFDRDPYLAVNEYGLPTLAVIVFFAVGLIITAAAPRSVDRLDSN